MDSFKEYLFHSLIVINIHNPNGKKTRINVNDDRFKRLHRPESQFSHTLLLNYCNSFIFAVNCKHLFCNKRATVCLLFPSGLVHNLKENIVFNRIPTFFISKNNTYGM